MKEVKNTHRAYHPESPTRRGNLNGEDKHLMEKSLDDLRAHLMENNEEFRRLATQHSEYKQRLGELASRHYLTDEEKIEEVRLKKLKLHLKDQMERILMQSRRAQSVA